MSKNGKNGLKSDDVLSIGFFLILAAMIIFAIVRGVIRSNEEISPGVYTSEKRCNEEARKSTSNTFDVYYCDYDFKDGKVIYLLKRQQDGPIDF